MNILVNSERNENRIVKQRPPVVRDVQQFVLRLPPRLSLKIRTMINQEKMKGVSIKFTTKRHGVFQINKERYHCSLLNIPTLVESYKSLDLVNYFKIGNIGQVVRVFDMPPISSQKRLKKIRIKRKNEDPIEEQQFYTLPDGITPPTKNIKYHFAKDNERPRKRDIKAFIKEYKNMLLEEESEYKIVPATMDELNRIEQEQQYEAAIERGEFPPAQQGTGFGQLNNIMGQAPTKNGQYQHHQPVGVGQQELFNYPPYSYQQSFGANANPGTGDSNSQRGENQAQMRGTDQLIQNNQQQQRQQQQQPSQQQQQKFDLNDAYQDVVHYPYDPYSSPGTMETPNELESGDGMSIPGSFGEYEGYSSGEEDAKDFSGFAGFLK